MFSSSSVRRALTLVLVLFSALAAFATSASAATRLFVVVSNGTAQVWELNPTTGQQIAFFVIAPPALPATRPGLAFNGTELFYTDENLAVVHVYSTTGALLRTLPKPAGLEPGSGLGVSNTALFLVGLDSKITAINPITGVFQSSFTLAGSMHSLTFAGSRGTIFASVNDSATIKELTPLGAVVNTIVGPDIFRGLGFSSFSNVLYGTRTGRLWAINPDTGALLAGYPVDLTDAAGTKPLKSGAAAADEAVNCGDGNVTAPETCDPPSSPQPNGQLCRQDCTFCGDGHLDTPEACDDGTSNSDTTPGACRTDCTLPACGDGVKDPNEACDDGNTVDNDACHNDCTLPLCGDGNLDTGEQCDDGPNNSDTTPGACRLNCTLPRCGDGIVDNPPEQCDDGNTVDEDGCDSNCTPELCGDGIIQPGLGEQCEPPNVGNCSADCHIPQEICTDFVDNDGDGLIDCLDPDCECGPIGRDPGAIRFDPSGIGDLFNVHGSFVPKTPVDPKGEIIGFLLSNQNGKIYEIKVAAGQLRQIGRNLFRFKDRIAQRNRSGLTKLDVRFYPKRNNYTFAVKTYGDLSAATEAEMSVEFVIGNDAFLNTSTWQSTSKGWLLTLPGE